MVLYYFIYSLVWIVAWLPLRVLYLFSDIMYPIIYYVVRYRKAVVRANIANSFPEKNKKELREIERRFYRFLGDLFVETIYEMHIGEAEIRRRMTYGNIGGIMDQYAINKSVMVMTAHYGNWEWTLGFPLSMPGSYTSNPIYKQQYNKRFNKLMYNLRAKYGAELIEKKELLRVMFRLQKEKKLGNFWMISDQTPNARSIHYWTNFLNQDTAAVVGTEVLARKFNYPVFFVDIKRVKRSFYELELVPITEHPEDLPEGEITARAAKLLETRIITAPEFWLWSHRRWKHKKS